MYKKFAFSLILVLSLFITKDAFAVVYPYTTTGTASLDTSGNYSVTGISSVNYAHLGLFTTPNIDNYAGQHFFEALPNTSSGNLFDTNLPNVHLNDYIPTPEGYYWGLTICSGGQYTITDCTAPVFFKALSTNTISDITGSVGGSTPLVSGIDKVSLYTLNNEDLDSITTPIPFDAGHQIHFFNYEEDSYHYLAYNMTICHNGHLEGCTVNNETFVEDVIDISSLGFSSSGNPPFSVKLNFKDVVTQSDLVNITWFLTNCPNVSASCPEGVSDGRGYTYLINDSLASDSWLTFDDPARPECSIARLDVCLINAVNYFIKPRSSGFANSFSVASTRINERIPFVYLYAVRDSISDIFNSPTASVNWSVSFGSVGSLTVLDSDSFSGSPYYSFFTGMRVYLSYLLWILLGVGLYKRAVRLFDDKTVA